MNSNHSCLVAIACFVSAPTTTVEASLIFGEGLVSYSKEGKSGFMDLRGNIVIGAQWDEVGKFSQNRAMVVREGKCGLIDSLGNVIVQPRWDSIRPFSFMGD